VSKSGEADMWHGFFIFFPDDAEYYWFVSKDIIKLSNHILYDVGLRGEFNIGGIVDDMIRDNDEEREFFGTTFYVIKV
jgi:hypothetical protein